MTTSCAPPHLMMFAFLSAPRSTTPSAASLAAAALIGALNVMVPTAVAQPVQAVPDTMAQRTLACTACHGKEGRATRDGYFPRIAGKPAGYLSNQLRNFRDGHRHHPQMTYMVAHLSDTYLNGMADYFASLELPYPPAQPAAMAAPLLTHGRHLALNGDPARKIPACTACHGEKLTGMQPTIPGLVGLSRDYLNAQFGAWRLGRRTAVAPDCMAEISRKLTPEDIGAVSAWLASQPVPADMTARPRTEAKLPVRCGSFPQ